MSGLWLAALLAGAPLFLSVIARTKAVMAGRRGPPLLQPYHDLAKLFRKGFVVSETTTWIFLAGPVASVVAPLLALLLLPLGARESWLSFPGDAILFVYAFGLARFFVTAAAMDTGSPFEGMGAAREASFSPLAEPALLFGLLALARLSGSLTLSGMLGAARTGAWRTASAAIVLVLASWFLVLLAENARLPFDDPSTHLELTMVHEVMVLDHAGPAFGLVLYGSALKLGAFAALLAALLPLPAGGWAEPAAFFCALLGVAVAVGLVESSMARLRLLRVPQLLVTATLLAGFAAVLLVR